MLRTLKHDYKGYSIELTPQGDYCSSFAVDIRDESGRLITHLGVAGNTEERAVERGKEVIDFEMASSTSH